MIRIWKGIEKEGIGSDSEIMTMFVCSDQQVSSDLLIEVFSRNPDISGIYFGAGRKSFAGMNPKDWDCLTSYCAKNNVSIVIEVSPTMLELFTKLYNYPFVTFVVSYYNVPKNINKLYFKTDDFVTTRIYTAEKNVDITEVKDDRYPDDVVIYEGE